MPFKHRLQYLVIGQVSGLGGNTKYHMALQGVCKFFW